MTHPTFTVENVTPELAQKWLGMNLQNRTLRNRAINAMANDMRNGRWEMTGEPIKFSADGVLRDGQHRLHALIQASAGNPEFCIPMVVARGVSAESQHVMDTGLKRTVTDALRLDGTKNASTTGTVARYLYLIEKGDYMTHEMVTVQEVRDWLAKHADLEEFVATHVYGMRSMWPGRPAPTLAAFWLMYQVDVEVAEEFFHGLVQLVGLDEGDPRQTAYRKFLDARNRGEVLSATDTIGFLLMTWNRWRKGHRNIRLIRPKHGWTHAHFVAK